MNADPPRLFGWRSLGRLAFASGPHCRVTGTAARGFRTAGRLRLPTNRQGFDPFRQDRTSTTRIRGRVDYDPGSLLSYMEAAGDPVTHKRSPGCPRKAKASARPFARLTPRGHVNGPSVRFRATPSRQTVRPCARRTKTRPVDFCNPHFQRRAPLAPFGYRPAAQRAARYRWALRFNDARPASIGCSRRFERHSPHTRSRFKGRPLTSRHLASLAGALLTRSCSARRSRSLPQVPR